MKVIILTGSIATGKSAVLNQFRQCGVVGLNADSIVHQLLAPGGEAVERVAASFPESVVAKGCPAYIDRKKLGNIVFGDVRKLRRLEHILHPLVRKKETEWIRKQRILGRKTVIVEVPLFFESHWQKAGCRYAQVMTTSASSWAMKKRALGRMHMTGDRLKNITARQWPTAKKVAFSDFVIHTGLGYGHAMRQVKQILAQSA